MKTLLLSLSFLDEWPRWSRLISTYVKDESWLEKPEFQTAKTVEN